jgi:hypothetical protein
MRKEERMVRKPNKSSYSKTRKRQHPVGSKLLVCESPRMHLHTSKEETNRRGGEAGVRAGQLVEMRLDAGRWLDCHSMGQQGTRPGTSLGLSPSPPNLPGTGLDGLIFVQWRVTTQLTSGFPVPKVNGKWSVVC